MSPSRRFTLLALRSFIWVGGAVLAFGLLMQVFPGALVLVAGVGATRSPYCSLWQGARDIPLKLARFEAAKKLKAATRLVRRDGGLDLYETPRGTYWVPGGNPEILPILLAQQETKIYGDLVRKGDVVFDCGAHVGVYTRVALDAGAARVIAIDPSPDVVRSFRRNFEKEIQSGRVTLVPKGIWDKEGTLDLFSNGSGGAGDSFVSSAKNAPRVAGIPVTTIDGLVTELGLPRVDVIKADVKGAGAKMLSGGARTLTQWKPRLAISTEEAPEDPAALATAALRLNPAYRLRCGPCIFDGDEIRTDVVFFE